MRSACLALRSVGTIGYFEAVAIELGAGDRNPDPALHVVWFRGGAFAVEGDVADDTDSFAGSDVFKRHARRAHGMHFTDGWPVQVGDSPAGASEEESARAARC